MNIKTIEEAKKFLNEKIYYPDTEEKKITTLYIGGVNLYYNQNDYEVEGFHLFQDKQFLESWGDVKLGRIKEEFDKNEQYMVYTFDKDLALDYLENQIMLESEGEKKREIEYAKEVFEKYNINYKIFN